MQREGYRLQGCQRDSCIRIRVGILMGGESKMKYELREARGTFILSLESCGVADDGC